jgi:hypothetical protein
MKLKATSFDDNGTPVELGLTMRVLPQAVTRNLFQGFGEDRQVEQEVRAF